MISKIGHIGIAVNNLDESIKIYEDLLGLECEGTETVEEQKVRVAFFHIGEVEIELLESTEPDGPIARYIEKNGPGIQHMALETDDIQNAIKTVKEKGARMIDEEPRYGAGGAKIAFIHPKSTGGVLIELCQHGD